MSKKGKKERSYAQKAATILQYWKAHPEALPTHIYEHYEHTTNGIRKKDFFKLANQYKEADKFRQRMANSNARPETVDKMMQEAYKLGVLNTPRGAADHVKKMSKKKQAIFKKRGKIPSIKDLENKMFKYHPTEDEYAEFY